MTIPERIVDKISLNHESGCWIWDGSLSGNGYGYVKIRGKMRLVHKVIYEAFKGPVPSHLEIDHICRLRYCVNPSHLEAVDNAENQRRKPKRTHCRNGHCYEEVGYYLYDGVRSCKRCLYEYQHKRRS